MLPPMRCVALVVLCPLLGCSSSNESAPSPPQPAVDSGTDVATEDASLDDPPIDARFEAFAKAFDDERRALGAPGAAVAVIENGKVAFAHGFGKKGPNSEENVRARTSFRIGSMTKVLTSVAVLRLADAGKVDLAANVKTVLPKLALDEPDLSSLRVSDLLAQRSGLRDYLVLNAPATQKTDAALATYLTSTTFKSRAFFMNPPGLFWNYSNPNFYIAGLVAEQASGVGYRELLSTQVFQPLGMTRTFFLGSEVIGDGDFANGKSKTDKGEPWDVAPDAYDNAWARPAGYAYSNVLDFARFVQFLHAGNPAVLSDGKRAELQASQVDTLESKIEHYGYGVFVSDGLNLSSSEYVATKVVAHGGDINGFGADFWLVPSTGFGVVALANADGAHFSKSIALAAKSFGSLPAATTPPDAKVDPASFDAFVGSYQDPKNVGRVTIERAGTDLNILLPDVEAAGVAYEKKLIPYTPNNFVLRIQGTQALLTFIADTTGKYAWMRTRFFVAKRSETMASHAVDGAAIRDALRNLPHAPLPRTLYAGR